MYRRGLTEKVIDYFDLGFDKKTHSITIPMRDTKGNIAFIKKRPITRTKFHKYHIEEGAEKRELVYALNFIREFRSRVRMIYLCEGEFDVLSCYVVGKYGAGLQGDRLYPAQVKQLVRIAKGVPICLLFDNDPPGIRAMKRAIPLLAPYFPLYKAKYPSGYKDPNDLLIGGLLEDLELEPVSPFGSMKENF
jgi:DNA primase